MVPTIIVKDHPVADHNRTTCVLMNTTIYYLSYCNSISVGDTEGDKIFRKRVKILSKIVFLNFKSQDSFRFSKYFVMKFIHQHSSSISN